MKVLMSNTKVRSMFAAMLGCLVLSACSTTGLDASSKFKCRIGDTVDTGCKSISETYSETVNGSGGAGTVSKMIDPNGSIRRTPYSGMPIRTPVSVMRVWVAPWEDKDGDLRDQSYFYLALNESRWQIAHNQEAIIDDYRPNIRLLGGTSGANGDKQASVVKASDKDMPDLGLDKTNEPDRTADPLSAMPKLIPPPVLP